MKYTITVRTAKGEAKGAAKMIRLCLVGMSKPTKTKISSDNSKIFWDCEGKPSQFKKDMRKVGKFDILMKMIVNNKLFQKTLKNKFDKDQQKEFMNMIDNQTSIEIIREPTLKELENDKSLVVKAWHKLLESKKQ